MTEPNNKAEIDSLFSDAEEAPKVKPKKVVSDAVAFFDNQETQQAHVPKVNDNATPDSTLDMVFNKTPSTKADLKEARRLRKEAESVEERGHAQPSQPSQPLPKSLIPEDAVNEDAAVPQRKNPTSPNIPEELLLRILRAEEVEADLVRTQGRFMPGSDDAKPGVPFKQVQAMYSDPSQMSNINPGVSDQPALEGITLRTPLINDLRISAHGVQSKGTRILDTGEGAQQGHSVVNPELVDHQVYGENHTVASSNPNDPRSESFLACNNRMCAYREGCLRYRLKNRRSNAFPFFPESCRKDGVYIGIDDSKFTGYDPFDQLERGAAGMTSLPLP